MTISQANQLIVPLTLASIPLGFVLYQLYYWFYWYAPVPKILKFTIDPGDRGGFLLRDILDNEIFKKYFKQDYITTDEGSSYPEKKLLSFRSIKVMESFKNNWDLADVVWHYALSLSSKDLSTTVDSRIKMLSDIYHTVGAVFSSLVLAYTFYLPYWFYVSFIYKPITINSLAYWLCPIGSLVINTICLCILFLVLKHNRKSSFENFLILKRKFIRIAFEKWGMEKP